jgi:CHAD domain-containing protein
MEHEGRVSLQEQGGKQLFLGRVPGGLGLAADLPEGGLREILAPVVAMRRLLPFAALDLQSQEFRLLNREAKTVVRLVCERGVVMSVSIAGEASSGRSLSSVLEVRPVQGYGRVCNRVLRTLEDRLKLERLAEGELERVCLALGRYPGDYSSKVQIELDPTAPMVTSARCIHLSLLSTLLCNEDGTRRDLDSEFLHDFRVAMRRTRSALSQIKGVFPAAAAAHFQSEFRWLGGVTGPTRDLDVFLLKLDDYRDALPSEIHQDLAPLGRLLRREQHREQCKLAKALDAQRYRLLLTEWRDFLENGKVPGSKVRGTVSSEAWSEEEQGPSEQQPTADIASARIWKIYRRVIRRGSEIREETPAEAVHGVRIDCKKLRYMMEFFKGLYPSAKVNGLLKILKQLQQNLGDFNDYEVQQENLAIFADRLLETSDIGAAPLLAMGRLQAYLAGGQAEERRRFGKVFAHFAERQHQKRFSALFKKD